MRRVLKVPDMSQVAQNHDLKKFNTFGIDARAALFAAPESIEELSLLMEEYDPQERPFLVIGEGSNILFKSDFQGLLVQPRIKGIELLEDDGTEVTVRVGAGEKWDSWVNHATSHGWFGLENLSLIPGSVGAAPVQNVGAYGAELEDHFAWLEAWDLAEKKMVRLRREECGFGYRNSIFKSGANGRYVITHVAFKLSRIPGINISYGNIREVFQEAGGSTPMDLRNVIISVRNRKLPDPNKIGNAGSFFKNPLVDRTIFKCIRVDYQEIPYYPEANNCVKIPAAWLIEKAGWKGKRIGNVGTWPAQPLVIVNWGGASGEDILEFSEQIRADVDQLFGVCLEQEVKVV
jgi:UDP-N-acetylmuramate dehydrogenase